MYVTGGAVNGCMSQGPQGSYTARWLSCGTQHKSIWGQVEMLSPWELNPSILYLSFFTLDITPDPCRACYQQCDFFEYMEYLNVSHLSYLETVIQKRRPHCLGRLSSPSSQTQKWITGICEALTQHQNKETFVCSLTIIFFLCRFSLMCLWAPWMFSMWTKQSLHRYWQLVYSGERWGQRARD